VEALSKQLIKNSDLAQKNHAELLAALSAPKIQHNSPLLDNQNRENIDLLFNLCRNHSKTSQSAIK
jgi:hypothetical protein